MYNLKPYFAKYLSEKPIKLDDKIRKLFLCSRDIQVGDKVKYGDNPTAPEHIVEASTECTTNKCWKVIGEISPEAVWVKEGDEFEEEEWRSAKRSDYTYVDYGKKIPLREGFFAEIKCPTCNKFH